MKHYEKELKGYHTSEGAIQFPINKENLLRYYKKMKFRVLEVLNKPV
jgi:uncharacterized protein YdhG (YjbR/CyaY superfamily)